MFKIKCKYYSNDCFFIFIGIILFICHFIFFVNVFVNIQNTIYGK